MSFLEWTPDLNTGIEWVDVQHKQIVYYINELHDAQDAGGSNSKLAEIMESLILYTAQHFTEEEKMLERAHYALLDTHKGIHRGFVDKLNGILKEFKAGQDTSQSLLKLLQSWLFSHIQVHDRGYIAIVQKAGVSLA
jgi:hemerythrin